MNKKNVLKKMTGKKDWKNDWEHVKLEPIKLRLFENKLSNLLFQILTRTLKKKRRNKLLKTQEANVKRGRNRKKIKNP